MDILNPKTPYQFFESILTLCELSQDELSDEQKRNIHTLFGNLKTLFTNVRNQKGDITLEYRFHTMILGELEIAREKFREPTYCVTALTEEVGELSRAILHFIDPDYAEHKEAWRDEVLKEAIQAAAMIYRIVIEGDLCHKLEPLLKPDGEEETDEEFNKAMQIFLAAKEKIDMANRAGNSLSSKDEVEIICTTFAREFRERKR